MKGNEKLKNTLKIVLAAVILICAPLVTMALNGKAEQPAPDDLADWMAELDGSLPLTMVNLPGTHDSAARFITPGYFLRDQDTSLSRQLENGFRYLDIRVALEEKKGEQHLILVHKFAKCRVTDAVFATPLTFADAVDAATLFLDEHPSETVIFCVKPERSKDDAALVVSLIEQTVRSDPERWYTDNAVPTLDQVRGKIVLCRRFDSALGLDFNWDDQGDPTVLAESAAAHTVSDTVTLYVQDRYHYSVEDKWNAVRATLENCRADENTFSLNLLSTAQGKLPHPRGFAKKLNALFTDWQPEQGSRYGVVLFDFGTPALARKVIETNGAA